MGGQDVYHIQQRSMHLTDGEKLYRSMERSWKLAEIRSDGRGYGVHQCREQGVKRYNGSLSLCSGESHTLTAFFLSSGIVKLFQVKKGKGLSMRDGNRLVKYVPISRGDSK